MKKQQYKCDLCGDQFHTKAEIVEHLEEHVAEAHEDLVWVEAQLEELKSNGSRE
jgi:hypothetical protein